MVNIFTSLIYQPFLNVLVFFYWLLGVVTRGHPDMGIAVILLTIVIRIVLLPISLMEDQSEKQRREIAQRAQQLHKELSHDPVQLRIEKKQLFRRNRRVVVGEIISLGVQVAISLMLWRMFATGLSGEDIHLIYPFMPQVTLPFDLVFLGKFDLTHTNFWLNLLQSVMVFIVETVAISTSPYPPMKGEVVRLQLVLPVISFLVFLNFPAGKKLFVITALFISLLITIYKYIRRRLMEYAQKEEEAEQMMANGAGGPSIPAEKIVVETK